jgi:ribosomal protein L16 Arg81 hydroxylase
MLFKKNFIDFKKNFNFNDLTNLLNSKQFESSFASSVSARNNFILEESFKIPLVQNEDCFKELFQYLNKIYNEKGNQSNLSIFFSLSGGSSGNNHFDRENVVLIGLYGKTLYIIGNKHYILEKGDLLFIERGVYHRAVSLEPRIVLSFGVFLEGEY